MGHYHDATSSCGSSPVLSMVKAAHDCSVGVPVLLCLCPKPLPVFPFAFCEVFIDQSPALKLKLTAMEAYKFGGSCGVEEG